MLFINQLTHSLSQRFSSWLDRRLPASAQKTLSHRDIFVLPTRWGLLYALMVVLILLTGINFQNSMVLAVGMFLIAVIILSIIFTYRSLAGLSVIFHGSQPCFASQSAAFEFILDAQESSRYAIEIGWLPDQFVKVDISAQQPNRVSIDCIGRRRGLFYPGRMLLTTTYPFGLIRAWSWQDMEAKALVFPQPIPAGAYHSAVASSDGEQSQHSELAGQDDFAGLKTYLPGESLNRVAWKKFAQTGEFFSKEFSRPGSDPEWVDFDAFTTADIELKLSYMTAMLCELKEAGAPFGLRMPGLTLPPQRDNQHFERCLSALALYPDHAVATF